MKPKKKTAQQKKTGAQRASSKKTKKPRGQKATGSTLVLNQQVWPVERDVLFRPERYKYVRKIISPDGCVFCAASSNAPKFETLCLYKTQFSMIVLNKFPYNSGHLLVLPLRHCGNLLDLNADEYQDLHAVLKLAVKACEKVYQPVGFNIGLNHGAVAGAGIPDHIHYHLVPRWAGDLNFFPLIAETKVVIESLEQSYARYSEFFQSI